MTKSFDYAAAVKFLSSGAVHPIVKNIVGRLHVSTPDADVITALHSKLSKGMLADPKAGTYLHLLDTQALKQHHENQRFYADVMRGR